MPILKRANSEDPDFQQLTALLDDELCLIYGTNKADFEEYNRIVDLKTVLVAYNDARPVGCGCFKTLDKSTIELKRMFVDPGFRGQGIASAMVGELESWARELGFLEAILETGNRQQEAINMYQKLGYALSEKPAQMEASGHSVFMRKRLV